MNKINFYSYNKQNKINIAPFNLFLNSLDSVYCHEQFISPAVFNLDRLQLQSPNMHVYGL